MSIITITSDYNSGNFYLAALKAALYKTQPAAVLVDIDTRIKPHNIMEAAFVVKSSLAHFPEKTIHFIAVGNCINNSAIIAQYQNQFVVAYDNGIFSFLFNDGKDVKYYKFSSAIGSFPELTLFPQAIQLISQAKLGTLEQVQPEQYTQMQLLSVNENQIIGTVIYIDGHSNAITNISKQLFEEKMKSHFEISLRKKLKMKTISQQYSDVKEGNELALFNHLNLLEISMYKGEAAQLLGLQVGMKIIIDFYD